MGTFFYSSLNCECMLHILLCMNIPNQTKILKKEDNTDRTVLNCLVIVSPVSPNPYFIGC